MPEREILPGLQLLGTIVDKYVFFFIDHDICSPIHLRFITIDNLYTPVSTGHDDNIFITKSYDATTHFETVAEDVADVWERVTVSGQGL